MMSKTRRAKPPKDVTTAISTVQSGGFGTVTGRGKRDYRNKNWGLKDIKVQYVYKDFTLETMLLSVRLHLT